MNGHQDEGGILIIGIRTIWHYKGTLVRSGDKLTRYQVYQYGEIEAREKYAGLFNMLRMRQTDKQLVAPLCFQYIVVTGVLAGSSVMRSINTTEGISAMEANRMK